MNLSSFTIRTERLLLRVAEPGDAAALACLMTEGISRWVAAWPYPLSLPVVDGLIAEAVADAAEGRALKMVMTTREGGRIIGWVRLDIDDSATRTADLGYWVAEDAQGQGYAYEAAAAVIDAGFHRLNLHAVEAGAQPANVASHRLLEKLGMYQVGDRRVFAPARQRYGICRFWRIERVPGCYKPQGIRHGGDSK